MRSYMCNILSKSNLMLPSQHAWLAPPYIFNLLGVGGDRHVNQITYRLKYAHAHPLWLVDLNLEPNQANIDFDKVNWIIWI